MNQFRWRRFVSTCAIAIVAVAGGSLFGSTLSVSAAGPTISGFSPTSGPVGTPVTITGSGFTGATSVSFNLVPASFSVMSDTTIDSTVPFGAMRGTISVHTPSGNVTSKHKYFKVTPQITGFTPTSGQPGTSVTISGSAFTSATQVTFNGVAATFTVDSYSQITATVPPAATSGPLAVTTTWGTGTSTDSFTVVAVAAHDDWTNFHHDDLHTGVSPDPAVGASTAPSLTQRWAMYAGGTGRGMAPIAASPAIVYNNTLQKTVVYALSVQGGLRAFDGDTGATIWSYTVTSGATVSSPAVDGNSVYFGATTGVLYAVDATTGQLQCTFDLPIVSPETVPGRIESSPVVGDVDGTGPVVFFGDEGQTEKVNQGHEWAINGVGNSNGQCTQKWAFVGFPNKGPHGTKTGSWSPTALGTDSTGRPLVVFGSSNPDDSVYALDARDGSVVWDFPTIQSGGDQDVGAGATISAPGVNGFADGVVYIDGKDRIEYALDLLNGTKLWSFDMAADSGLTTNSVSTAAIVGNRVVVSYSSYTYALDATTGVKLWRTAATSTTLSSPAVSGAPGDQVVFVGSEAGGEHGYNLSDGSLVFSVSTGHKIVSSAAVSNGMLFFGDYSGHLFGFAPAGGS